MGENHSVFRIKTKQKKPEENNSRPKSLSSVDSGSAS